MKKRTKLLLLLLGAFVVYTLLALISFGINKLQTVIYYKSYRAIAQGVSSANYIIKKVPVKGRSFNYISEHGINSSDYKYSSFLGFDTLKRLVRLECDEHLIMLDTLGNVKAKKLIDHQTDSLRYNNCILLRGDWPVYSSRSEEKQPFYFKHFSKEEFVTDNYFDFNIFPTPTGNGSSPKAVWWGTAYFQIAIDKENLNFKVPSSSTNLISTPGSMFDNSLNYYEIPAKYCKNTAFLFDFITKELYVARHK